MKTIVKIYESPRNIGRDFSLLIETSNEYSLAHHILIAKLDLLYLEISHEFGLVDILKPYSLLVDGIYHQGIKSKIVSINLLDSIEYDDQRFETSEIFHTLYNTIINELKLLNQNPEIAKYLHKTKTTHPDLYILFSSLIDKALLKEPYEAKWIIDLNLPKVEPFEIEPHLTRKFIELKI